MSISYDLKRQHLTHLTFLVFVLLFVFVAGGGEVLAATYTVSKTADTNDGTCDVDCSLREAIVAANASSGDFIHFNIDGSTDGGCAGFGGVCTIGISSGLGSLPVLTGGSITIDGFTQSGASANTNGYGSGLNSVLRIMIDGSALGGGIDGLSISSGANVVKGLSIVRFPDHGLVIGSGSGNKVQGCFIGVHPDGVTDLGNGSDAVNIAAASNVVGTDGNGSNDVGERNLLSGNGSEGVYTNAASNRISGNIIGLNAMGTGLLSNAHEGVEIFNAANNIVGTDGDGTSDLLERNVISGNILRGVYIYNAGATGNRVAGNLIGTDITGAVDLGNSLEGVLLATSATVNYIGTNGDGFGDVNEGNVISGNNSEGVLLSSGSNIVAGNIIGLTVTGDGTLANSSYGVYIANAGSNRIGTNGDGVSDVVERNVVSSHPTDGIRINGALSSNNRVAGNYIGVALNGTSSFPNLENGIHLMSSAANNIIGSGGDGTESSVQGNVIAFNGDGTNDTGVLVEGASTDGNDIKRNSFYSNSNEGIRLNGDGANNNQPVPAISSHAASGSSLIISGNGSAGTTVQLFDASTDNEGQVYLGEGTANGSGAWSITITSAYTSVNNTLVATQTEGTNGTSEFSAVYTITNNSPNAPTALGPATLVNSSSTTDATPTFSFTLSDVDVNDTLQYRIQIDDTSNFSSPVIDYTSALQVQGAATFTVGQTAGSGSYAAGTQGAVLQKGSYYWRVQAIDYFTAVSGQSTANGGAVAFIESAYTVNTTADSSSNCDVECSLREAITAANGGAGNTVQFEIDGSNDAGCLGYGEVCKISPTSALPTITANSMVIDGYTQDGAAENTNLMGNVTTGFNPMNTTLTIAIDGTGAGAGVDGLSFNNPDNVTIKGLNIRNFSDEGISAAGSTINLKVQGCFIGTDETGEVDNGNGGIGIELLGSSTATIGTDGDGVDDEKERNLISGNSSYGFYTAAANNSVVSGNFFGTDKDGVLAIGNSDGLFSVRDIRVGTDGNGIADGAEGNLFSGNNSVGIQFADTAIVAGNIVGLNAAGTGALPNAYGVYNNLSASSRIGTNADGTNDTFERNVISGNTTHEIYERSAGGSPVVIAGNYIGLGVDGTVVIASASVSSIRMFGGGGLLGTNGDGVRDSVEKNYICGSTAGHGVEIFTSNNNTIAGNSIGIRPNGGGCGAFGNGVVLLGDSDNNLIGGDAAGESNTISGHGTNGSGDGVNVANALATGNRVLRNSIYNNRDLGIDLSVAGANNDIANPFVMSQSASSTQLSLAGTALANSTVQIFGASTETPPSTIQEGQSYITEVTVDGTGNWSVNLSAPYNVTGSQMVMTATSTTDGTSEFSSVYTVVNQAPVAMALNVDGTEDTNVSITLSGVDANGDALVSYDITALPAKGSLYQTPDGTTRGTKITTIPTAVSNGSHIVIFSGGTHGNGTPYDSFGFTVDDGTVDSAAATVSIDLAAVNDVPVAFSATYATNQGTGVAISLAGTDYDGDSITYSMAAAPSQGVISGFDGTTGSLNYIPNASFVGSDSFTFVANDGTINSVPATINLTVNAFARNVSFTAASQSGTEDTIGTMTATVVLSAASSHNITIPFTLAGSATVNSDYTADGSPLTISAGATAANIVATIYADSTFEGNETVQINMGAPVNASTGATTAHSMTILEDSTGGVSVTLSLSGSPFVETGGSATVTAQLSGVSALPVTTNLAFSGTASNLLDYTRSGNAIVIASGATVGSITLTALHDNVNDDGETVIVDIDNVTNGAESGTQQVTATITDDDEPPIVNAGADQGTAPRIASGSIVTLTGNATDGDGDVLTYLWIQSEGTTVNLSSITNLTTDFTSATGFDDETYSFTLTANDGSNQGSDSVSVIVNGKPIALSYATQVNDFGITNLSLNGYDAGGDGLNTTVTLLPAHGNVYDDEVLVQTVPHVVTGDLYYEADFSMVQDRIEFYVSDGVQNSDVGEVILHQTAGNTPPVLQRVGNHIIGLSQAFTLNVTSDDADMDVMSYSLDTTGKPGWLTLTDNGDGTAVLTGMANTTKSSYKLRLVVSDGTDVDMEVFVLRVGEGIGSMYVNDSTDGAQTGLRGNGVKLDSKTPVFSSKFMRFGETSVSHQSQVSDAGDFSAPHWSSGTVAFVTPVTSSNRSEDVVYAGTALNHCREYFWRTRMKYNVGVSTTPWSPAQAFFTPCKPEIHIDASDEISINAGESYDGSLNIVDRDSDTVTCAVIGTLPTGAVVTAACRFQWNPSLSVQGDHSVVVRATDSDGNFTDVDFTVTVVGGQSAVSLQDISNVTIQANHRLSVILEASDSNGNPITYSCTSNCPQGLAVNATTGEIVWTPTSYQIGTYSNIIFKADNGQGGADTIVVKITVVPDQTPIQLTLPDSSSVVDAPVILKPSINDDSNATLFYEWTQTDGDDVELDDVNDERPSFVAPSTPQTLVFSLFVTDGVRSATAEQRVKIFSPDGIDALEQTSEQWIAAAFSGRLVEVEFYSDETVIRIGSNALIEIDEQVDLLPVKIINGVLFVLYPQWQKNRGAVFGFDLDRLTNGIRLTLSDADYEFTGTSSNEYLGVFMSAADVDEDGELNYLIPVPGSSHGHAFVLDEEFNIVSFVLGTGQNPLKTTSLVAADFSGNAAGDIIAGVGSTFDPNLSSLSLGEQMYASLDQIQNLSHFTDSFVFEGRSSLQSFIDLQNVDPDIIISGNVSRVAAGDINFDGKEDLVYASLTDSTLVTLLGSENIVDDLNLSQSSLSTDADTGEAYGYAIHVAEVSGDQYHDVIVGAPLANGGNGRVYIYFGGPTMELGGFYPFVLDGSTNSNLGIAIEAGDVDNDGINDLILQTVDGRTVLLNLANYTETENNDTYVSNPGGRLGPGGFGCGLVPITDISCTNRSARIGAVVIVFLWIARRRALS